MQQDDSLRLRRTEHTEGKDFFGGKLDELRSAIGILEYWNRGIRLTRLPRLSVLGSTEPRNAGRGESDGGQGGMKTIKK